MARAHALTRDEAPADVHALYGANMKTFAGEDARAHAEANEQALRPHDLRETVARHKPSNSEINRSTGGVMAEDPLRLSIVIEWANTRLNGEPRAAALLERLDRQWQELLACDYPPDAVQRSPGVSRTPRQAGGARHRLVRGAVPRDRESSPGAVVRNLRRGDPRRRGARLLPLEELRRQPGFRGHPAVRRQ